MFANSFLPARLLITWAVRNEALFLIKLLKESYRFHFSRGNNEKILQGRMSMDVKN